MRRLFAFGEATADAELPRSILPLRARIFGERNEAKFGSTLDSPSLYEAELAPTVEPDLMWKDGVERTVGDGAESLAVILLEAAEDADMGL